MALPALLLTLALATAGRAPTLRLPAGEDPAEWHDVAHLTGLAIKKGSGTADATLEAAGANWIVRIGEVRVLVTAPRSEVEREDLAWLVASLLTRGPDTPLPVLPPEWALEPEPPPAPEPPAQAASAPPASPAPGSAPPEPPLLPAVSPTPAPSQPRAAPPLPAVLLPPERAPPSPVKPPTLPLRKPPAEPRAVEIPLPTPEAPSPPSEVAPPALGAPPPTVEAPPGPAPGDVGPPEATLTTHRVRPQVGLGVDVPFQGGVASTVLPVLTVGHDGRVAGSLRLRFPVRRDLVALDGDGTVREWDLALLAGPGLRRLEIAAGGGVGFREYLDGGGAARPLQVPYLAAEVGYGLPLTRTFRLVPCAHLGVDLTGTDIKVGRAVVDELSLVRFDLSAEIVAGRKKE